MGPLVLKETDPRLTQTLPQLLELGGVFIFPTDTVYGLGGNPWDRRVLAHVRRLKGRSKETPFTLHLATLADVERFALIDERTRRAVASVLPGPLTLLLPARKGAPQAAVRRGKVGIRVPAHPFFARVLAPLGRPLFGTSVNRSGAPPLMDIEQMIERFSAVDLIIEGTAGSGIPSAIIDLTVSPPQALRGKVPEGLR